MGATLFLTPLSGNFDLSLIEQFLATTPGLIEDEHDPRFISFSNQPHRRRKRRALDLQNKDAPEHRCPYLRYSPALIEFGINWSDTVRNDGCTFLGRVLSTFECKGQDDEGFCYEDSERCRSWLQHWLPVH